MRYPAVFVLLIVMAEAAALAQAPARNDAAGSSTSMTAIPQRAIFKISPALRAAVGDDVTTESLAQKEQSKPAKKNTKIRSYNEYYREQNGRDLEGLRQSMASRIRAQRNELYLLKGALLAYIVRHRALPSDPRVLIGPETRLDRMPQDQFLPGRPVSYRLSKDGQEAFIYSVGPDGRDDGGKRFKVKSANETPQGDIVDRVSLPELLEHQQENWAETNKIYDALFAISRRTGRDNAMLHYYKATYMLGFDVMGFMPIPGYERELIQATLKEGWTEKSRPLLMTLARFEPILAEVKTGAALDYAVNDPGPADVYQSPGFFAVQTLTDILCMEGLYLEAMGQPARAMDDYLAALTVGRDFSRPKTTLMGMIISRMAQQRALDQIGRLARSVSIDRAVLERCAARLKAIEATEGRCIEIIENEYCNSVIMQETVIKIISPVWLKPEPGEKPEELAKRRQEVMLLMKRQNQTKTLMPKMIEWEKTRFSLPYWERAAKGYTDEAFQKQFGESVFLFTPDTATRVDAQRGLLLVRMINTRVMIALELYRRDKGEYPNTLNALMPGLLEAVPIDPFSGRAVQYRRIGQGYKLFSAGPNTSDEAGAVSYDPTNGVISGGDIVFPK